MLSKNPGQLLSDIHAYSPSLTAGDFSHGFRTLASFSQESCSLFSQNSQKRHVSGKPPVFRRSIRCNLTAKNIRAAFDVENPPARSIMPAE
jgi:hypothetical protein